jgi:fructokinase
MGKLVVSFGELLWDVFPTGEVLGGAPANLAYRLNSLGHSARLVTRLGHDNRGERAAKILQEHGMSTEFVQWDRFRPTGSVPVELDASGSPTFTIQRDVAYDAIETTPALLELARTADCICFGTLIQRSEISRKTLHAMLDASREALRVLDLNLRKDCYTRETIEASLARANILKVNEDEAVIVARMFDLPETYASFAPTAVKRWNLEACVVTLGAKGMVAANRAGDFGQVAGTKVDVVDTVGSGDAVTAGFIHCFLNNVPLAEACEFANMMGTRVAQTRGGMQPIALPNFSA